MHPALFASVDSGGRLDLWNLNQDTEVPAANVMVEGNPALNRVSWTPSGLHVTVGDNLGKIWVYDVAEVRICSSYTAIVVTDISFQNFAHPRHDEWNKFVYTIQELRNNQVDEEVEKLNLNVSNPSSLTMTSMSPSMR